MRIYDSESAKMDMIASQDSMGAGEVDQGIQASEDGPLETWEMVGDEARNEG
jgi:hypothetical protein